MVLVPELKSVTCCAHTVVPGQQLDLVIAPCRFDVEKLSALLLPDLGQYVEVGDPNVRSLSDPDRCLFTLVLYDTESSSLLLLK